MTESPTPRAERRRRTEQRILVAARHLFGERGFERTTIRAIAASARVDPALVMQYFGSKDQLFSQAVRMPLDESPPRDAEQLTELVLANLEMKISGLPEGSLAMMRSMLTHPEATEAARAALNRQTEQLAAGILTEDAQLRGALITTIMLGVTIGQQLLELDALCDARPHQVADLLRPCVRALTAMQD